MINLNSLNKKELRAACKEAGIKGYSKLTTGGMRDAIRQQREEVLEAQIAGTLADAEAEAEAEAEATMVAGYVPTDEEAELEQQANDQFAKEDAEPSAEDKLLINAYGTAYCPHCGTHLGNGVQDFEGMRDHAKQEGKKSLAISHEFMCLGCGEEFGAEVEKAPSKPASAPVSSGTKIEKNRPKQNGVSQPSIGGVCREVWDFCSDFYAEHGEAPKPSKLKVVAHGMGWNPNNATIELYQWRKFHGIRGRNASKPTETETK